jgi:shikimate 5-dehydrogenase
MSPVSRILVMGAGGSEKAILVRAAELGASFTDLQVNQNLAWAKFFHLTQHKYVRVEAEYGTASSDESVADELVRLAREAGY